MAFDPAARDRIGCIHNHVEDLREKYLSTKFERSPTGVIDALCAALNLHWSEVCYHARPGRYFRLLLTIDQLLEVLVDPSVASSDAVDDAERLDRPFGVWV